MKLFKYRNNSGVVEIASMEVGTILTHNFMLGHDRLYCKHILCAVVTKGPRWAAIDVLRVLVIRAAEKETTYAEKIELIKNYPRWDDWKEQMPNNLLVIVLYQIKIK